jgi:hypothetical protein
MLNRTGVSASAATPTRFARTAAARRRVQLIAAQEEALMHDDILIAFYPSRADAERARDGLRKIGVAATDIGLSADVPTATAELARADVPEGAVEAGVPDYDRDRYGSELDDGGRTVVAVRLGRSGAGRPAIVRALEAGGPLGFAGDTAATAADSDLVPPEPAGWVSERIAGRTEES